jgi:isopenicillin N synthase-like dioxygenase
MIGPDVPNKPPFRRFREANIWPDSRQIPEQQFKEPLLAYHEALSKLSSQIMHILARGLTDFETGVFEEFCEDPIASVRLLHYPPHPKSDDSSLVGAGAHTDFGAITLLLQDRQSGLEVFNHQTNEWFDIPPQSDAYVVNIGDMLEAWTSGRYKSNLHRVVNKSGTDRYSVPFFYNGHPDCVIRPLDGTKGKEFTVEEHLLSRYKASYG